MLFTGSANPTPMESRRLKFASYLVQLELIGQPIPACRLLGQKFRRTGDPLVHGALVLRFSRASLAAGQIESSESPLCLFHAP